MKMKIIFDFVCPYCYVANRVMWKALKEEIKNIEFQWYPYELNPEPNEEKLVTEERAVYFLEHIVPIAKLENIEVNFPRVSPIPRTALAFEGLEIAKEFKKDKEYINSVMDSYWLENKNIGDIDILGKIAKDIGISEEYFKKGLLENKYKEAHKKLNLEVSEWDFEVVPTFYIDDIQIKKFPTTVKEWLSLNKIEKKN
ncbi:MAG: DsbA family oxidoreductase [Fusobacteriaceae bacterium]